MPMYSCTFESTFSVFFTFCFLGWNFVWLYDLVKVFKQPMHTTDQLLYFYKLVVYISAFFIADFFFSIKDSIYTMVCFLAFFYFSFFDETMSRTSKRDQHIPALSA